MNVQRGWSVPTSTPASHLVVADLFHMHDTLGVPLSISLMILSERGCAGDIAQFFFRAIQHGWKFETTIKTIEYAMRDNELPFDKEEFVETCLRFFNVHQSIDTCVEALKKN